MHHTEKDPEKIWNDVSKSTEKIIIRYCKPKFLISLYREYIKDKIAPKLKNNNRLNSLKNKFENRFPNDVLINLYDYPANSLENLEGLPINLPNLEVLDVKYHKFKSFQGLPVELPNLKKLVFNGYPLEYLGLEPLESGGDIFLFEKISKRYGKTIGSPISNEGAPLSNLSGLPANLPNLEYIYLSYAQLENLLNFPKSTPSLKSLIIRNTRIKSLKGLPSILPSLESFEIKNCPLEKLKNLPDSIPSLKNLKIIDCNLISLKYIPTDTPNLEIFDLGGNQIISLKELPPIPPKIKKFNISRNKLTTWEFLPLINYQNDISKISQNPIKTLYGLTTRDFFDIYFLHKINSELNSQFNRFDFCPYSLNLLKKFSTPKLDDEGLTRITFNEEIFKEIIKLYRKSPMELAIQYTKNKKSLTKGELDRLCWEAEADERKILENTLLNNDSILQKIDQRLSAEIKNGYKIFL